MTTVSEPVIRMPGSQHLQLRWWRRHHLTDDAVRVTDTSNPGDCDYMHRLAMQPHFLSQLISLQRRMAKRQHVLELSPTHVTSAPSLPIFQRQLKTALFTRCYPDCAARAQQHLHLLLWLASLFFLYCTVSWQSLLTSCHLNQFFDDDDDDDDDYARCTTYKLQTKQHCLRRWTVDRFWPMGMPFIGERFCDLDFDLWIHHLNNLINSSPVYKKYMCNFLFKSLQLFSSYRVHEVSMAVYLWFPWSLSHDNFLSNAHAHPRGESFCTFWCLMFTTVKTLSALRTYVINIFASFIKIPHWHRVTQNRC